MINTDVSYEGRKVINDPIKDQYAVNHKIRQAQVRLVEEDGSNRGVISTSEALSMAQKEHLDLVLINAATTPPVARICDYSKFIYELKIHKKEQARKLRENAIHIKEIQLRPGISEHDLEVKVGHAKEWLADNCKIKIVVKFRGREFAYKQKGFEIISHFVGQLGCKVETAPNLNNNSIIAVVMPIRPTK
jgi:translation initiation factor IF-3